MTDEKYMQRCLQLAQLGAYYVAPNPMVGAVLVAQDGTIIGEGWHQRYGGPHAEPNCLADAERRNPNIDYSHTTLYVSLEPCSHYGKTPPCANLIVSKGIGHVVIGCLDPNPQVSGRGVRILQDAGIEVKSGVLERECRWLNRRFLTLQEKHRPYVILKWAQTADGYLDYHRNDGEPLQISTVDTKALVHKLRAENMAILVGSGTALLDNPHLTTKHWPGRNPVRILLDRHQRVPATARIFSDEAETIVYDQRTDWEYILSDLAQRNIHSLIVEGGAQVLESAFPAGIYDEIHIEIADLHIGDGVKAPDASLYNKLRKLEEKRYEKNHTLVTYIADHMADPSAE